MRSLLVCAAVALAGALAAGRPAAPSARTDSPEVLSIGGPATPRDIPAGFLGLSFEYWAVRDYAGPNPRHVNPVFLQLVRNLAGGSAPELRIGGDTTDTTWLPVAGQPVPAGVGYGLTRRWISIIGAVAAKLGARMTLGINLEADSATIAAAEASALVDGVGSRRVEALEAGNEPELYGVFTWGSSGAPGRPQGWDFTSYDQDFARTARALRGLPLAGPAVGQPDWFGYLRPFLADQPRVRLATLHRYPLQLCFIRPEQSEYPDGRPPPCADRVSGPGRERGRRGQGRSRASRGAPGR